MNEAVSEAVRQAKHLEAPNEHMLNPQKCFGCGSTYDSGESGGYTGIVACFCGICLMAAIDKAERRKSKGETDSKRS